MFSKSIEVHYDDLYQKINQEKNDHKNGLLVETENEMIFINYEKPYGQYFLDRKRNPHPKGGVMWTG